MRLGCPPFGDLGRKTLKKFVSVHAFFGEIAHGLPGLFLVLHDDARALSSKTAESFRRRTVDHVSSSPDARPSDGSVPDAFSLRDDPIHRIIGYGWADHDNEVKITFPHPITQVAMPVDESR